MRVRRNTAPNVGFHRIMSASLQTPDLTDRLRVRGAHDPEQTFGVISGVRALPPVRKLRVARYIVTRARPGCAGGPKNPGLWVQIRSLVERASWNDDFPATTRVMWQRRPAVSTECCCKASCRWEVKPDGRVPPRSPLEMVWVDIEVGSMAATGCLTTPGAMAMRKSEKWRSYLVSNNPTETATFENIASHWS